MRDAEWVYVLCPDCEGFTYAAADVRGMKREIKEMLYEASQRGLKTVRRATTVARRMPACSCPWPTNTGGDA